MKTNISQESNLNITNHNLSGKRSELIISILEARKLLGEVGKNYSDKEISEVILTLTLLSDIVIDSTIAKYKGNTA